MDHEHVGRGAELKGDPILFLVSFDVIAQFQPALGCLKLLGGSRLRIEPPSHSSHFSHLRSRRIMFHTVRPKNSPTWTSRLPIQPNRNARIPITHSATLAKASSPPEPYSNSPTR